MTTPKFGIYPGWGEFSRKNTGYSQAVRIGDRIEIAGQGGWDPSSTSIPTFDMTIEEEIAQAFKNVEIALKTVGGKGWSQVYRMNSYHTEITPEVFAIMSDNIKKYSPEGKIIWTETGAHQLGAPGMRVEIEVVAYAPEGGGR